MVFKAVRLGAMARAGAARDLTIVIPASGAGTLSSWSMTAAPMGPQHLSSRWPKLLLEMAKLPGFGSSESGIVFDAEIIYLARRRGYRIAIVPVQWSDKRGSRMRVGLRPAAKVGWDILRVPLLHFRAVKRLETGVHHDDVAVHPQAVLKTVGQRDFQAVILPIWGANRWFKRLV